MKVTVTFKTPDALLDRIQEVLPPGAYAAEALEAVFRRWVRYGEYIDVEFDLGDGTARVLEQSRQ